MKSAPIYFIQNSRSAHTIPLDNEISPTYINRKLPTHPHQLRSIHLQFPNPRGVRFEGIDGIFAQLVDAFEVAGEGAGVLVVFGGDVGCDGVGELDGVGAAEGDLEDVAGLHSGSERGWYRSTVRMGLRWR